MKESKKEPAPLATDPAFAATDPGGPPSAPTPSHAGNMGSIPIGVAAFDSAAAGREPPVSNGSSDLAHLNPEEAARVGRYVKAVQKSRAQSPEEFEAEFGKRPANDSMDGFFERLGEAKPVLPVPGSDIRGSGSDNRGLPEPVRQLRDVSPEAPAVLPTSEITVDVSYDRQTRKLDEPITSPSAIRIRERRRWWIGVAAFVVAFAVVSVAAFFLRTTLFSQGDTDTERPSAVHASPSVPAAASPPSSGIARTAASETPAPRPSAALPPSSEVLPPRTPPAPSSPKSASSANARATQRSAHGELERGVDVRPPSRSRPHASAASAASGNGHHVEPAPETTPTPPPATSPSSEIQKKIRRDLTF